MNWDAAGDLATWFTGLLTAGSLFLGFTILRNDRMKEERAQASRFIVSHFVGGSDDSDMLGCLVVEVFNLSDRPIFAPTLLGKDLLPVMGWVFPSPSDDSRLYLRSGEESTIRHDFDEEADIDDMRVEFEDANGTHWIYHLQSKRLEKMRPRPSHGRLKFSRRHHE